MSRADHAADAPATPASRVGRATAALLGLGFLVSALTGAGRLYVRSWFLPGLVVGGLALLLAAWRGRPAMSPWATAVLALPLAVGLGLTPEVAGRVPAGEVADLDPGSRLGDRSNPLLAGKGGEVTLLELLHAERELGRVYLAGRSVTVEGVVSGARTISRLAMVCCAADARSISLEVWADELPAPGTWVRVAGRLSAGPSGLALDATQVDRIPTPEAPFL